MSISNWTQWGAYQRKYYEFNCQGEHYEIDFDCWQGLYEGYVREERAQLAERWKNYITSGQHDTEIYPINYELNAYRARRDAVAEKCRMLESTLSSKQGYHFNLENRKIALQSQKITVETTCRQLKEKHDYLTTDLNHGKQRQENTKLELENSKKEYDKSVSKTKELCLELGQSKVDLKKLRQELKVKEQLCQNIKRTLDQLKRTIETLKQEKLNLSESFSQEISRLKKEHNKEIREEHNRINSIEDILKRLNLEQHVLDTPDSGSAYASDAEKTNEEES